MTDELRHYYRRAITGELEIVDRKTEFVRCILPYDYRFTCNSQQYFEADIICRALEEPTIIPSAFNSSTDEAYSLELNYKPTKATLDEIENIKCRSVVSGPHLQSIIVGATANNPNVVEEETISEVEWKAQWASLSPSDADLLSRVAQMVSMARAIRSEIDDGPEIEMILELRNRVLSLSASLAELYTHRMDDGDRI